VLEKPLSRDDVVADVSVELVPPAGPDPGLASEVIDDARAFEGCGEVRVNEVELFE
jgi:hypothetical protein